MVHSVDSECVMVTTSHFASVFASASATKWASLVRRTEIITIYRSMSKINASNGRNYDANAVVRGEDRRNSTCRTKIGAGGGTQTKLDIRIYRSKPRYKGEECL